MDEKRLDKIEAKIDKLIEVITDIARAEERIIATNNRVDVLEKRVNTTQGDLQAIAIMSRKNALIMAFANTAFWLVAGGVIAYFIKSD